MSYSFILALIVSSFNHICDYTSFEALHYTSITLVVVLPCRHYVILTLIARQYFWRFTTRSNCISFWLPVDVKITWLCRHFFWAGWLRGSTFDCLCIPVKLAEFQTFGPSSCLQLFPPQSVKKSRIKSESKLLTKVQVQLISHPSSSPREESCSFRASAVPIEKDFRSTH